MASVSNLWQRSYSERQGNQQEEELLVFGYSCKIFRDDEKATFIDQGKHLIPWMGDKTLMIDRYDVRGYLHDLKPYEAKPSSDFWLELTEEEKHFEKLCDEERYLALRKDLTEEQMYHEEELKRLRAALASDGAYHEIGFTYENAESNPTSRQFSNIDKAEEPDDEPYHVPPGLNIPKGIQTPSNMKIHTIIEKTATFISQQGGQMEIIIKMKQASNPQFAFMHFDNPLNPYYKQLVKEIKAGHYKPPPSKKPDIEPDEEEDDDNYLHPSLMSGKAEFVPKFTVPSINFRRTSDDSYSLLVKNLKQQIIEHARSNSPNVQSSEENSGIDSPDQVAADVENADSDNENVHHRETKMNPAIQPPPPGEENDENEERQSTTSSSSRSESPINDSSSEEALESREVRIIPPPPDIQPIIDKMAEYVAKNGEDFEFIVKSKKDKRFDFLHSWHEYYQYYILKRKAAMEKKSIPDPLQPVQTGLSPDSEDESEPDTELKSQSDSEPTDAAQIEAEETETLQAAQEQKDQTEEELLQDLKQEMTQDLNQDKLPQGMKQEKLPQSLKQEELLQELKLSDKEPCNDVPSNVENALMKQEEKTKKEETKPKIIPKVIKGPISFSLRSKDSDTINLEKKKKRTLLLDDSEGDDDGNEDPNQKIEAGTEKGSNEDSHIIRNSKDGATVEVEEKSRKLTSEEMEAKMAEDRFKDKLAAAARERLAQQKRERQLQLERKRRAALFLNMLKSSPLSSATKSEDTGGSMFSYAAGTDVAANSGSNTRLDPAAEEISSDKNGDYNLSPSVSEITSPRNGTILTFHEDHATSLPLSPECNPLKENQSSSSSSSSSSESNSELKTPVLVNEETSPVKKKRAKKKLKKKKKHSHSSKSQSTKTHNKSRSKAKKRSRSHSRSKAHKRARSRSRSHKHKRSRSRSVIKRSKTPPAAYAVTRRSRSKSRSPKRHRLSSRLSPLHRLWRKQ